MSMEDDLRDRSGEQCELCGSNERSSVYQVPPGSDEALDTCVLLCSFCREQIDDPTKMVVQHWHCLKDSMWNTTPVVQVMAWRMLSRLDAEIWARDLLDMLYLDDETLAWARSGLAIEQDGEGIVHRDCNGTALMAGDTVTLIKDLNVKGANFTAKRGTAVRGISLVPDNDTQIEGRVNGQQIVILTEFVKKLSHNS